MRLAPLLLISCAIVVPATARASNDPALDAFVADVLQKNPSLGARASRRDALTSESRAAGIYPDPQVSVMLDRVPQAHAYEMPMVRYQITQMFPWPGKLPLMRTAVERQRESASADVDVRKLDLRLAAKRTWFMLALNTKEREINRASRGLATTIAQSALGRYSTGLGGHHEVARAQVEVNALDVDLTRLDGERMSMVAMVNALRNQPVDTPFADPSFTPAPRADYALVALAQKAVANRPELRGMRAMRDESIAMADLARRERYPDFMGSVWANQNLMGAPPSGGVMLGMTIPVFGYTRQGHRADAFDARAEGSARDADAMRAMIRFEVADALARVQATTRRVELIETVVLPKARESFETSLAGYGTSGVDIVGLLDARRSLQTASLALAEAQAEREVALAELERAVGGTP
jgi:outer membrane protein, heavy metal efflux system